MSATEWIVVALVVAVVIVVALVESGVKRLFDHAEDPADRRRDPTAPAKDLP